MSACAVSIIRDYLLYGTHIYDIWKGNPYICAFIFLRKLMLMYQFLFGLLSTI